MISGGVILVLAVFFIMYFSFKNKEDRKPPVLPSAIQMNVFSGENPPFNFSFEYPRAWRVMFRNYEGDYDMVEILNAGVENSATVPGFFITKSSLREAGTLEVLMDSWIKEENRYRGFALASRQEIQIAGQEALQAEYRYKTKLPLRTAGAPDTVIKKKHIVLIREDYSIQITFAGDEEQFNFLQPIFDHVLATFRFADQA